MMILAQWQPAIFDDLEKLLLHSSTEGPVKVT